jgi:hypothetical protein
MALAIVVDQDAAGFTAAGHPAGLLHLGVWLAPGMFQLRSARLLRPGGAWFVQRRRCRYSKLGRPRRRPWRWIGTRWRIIRGPGSGTGWRRPWRCGRPGVQRWVRLGPRLLRSDTRRPRLRQSSGGAELGGPRWRRYGPGQRHAVGQGQGARAANGGLSPQGPTRGKARSLFETIGATRDVATTRGGADDGHATRSDHGCARFGFAAGTDGDRAPGPWRTNAHTFGPVFSSTVRV